VDFRVRHEWIDAQSITDKLVRNPAYPGKKVGLNGWTVVPLDDRMWKTKPALMEALEESILRAGMRNPIIVYRLPECTALLFGSCRWRVGVRHRLQIPAIVVDYTASEHSGVPVTPENWQTFFVDVPAYFEFTEYGVDTHYSLEKNRSGNVEQGLAWLEGQEERVRRAVERDVR
jgi:hypothetical protein